MVDFLQLSIICMRKPDLNNNENGGLGYEQHGNRKCSKPENYVSA